MYNPTNIEAVEYAAGSYADAKLAGRPDAQALAASVRTLGDNGITVDLANLLAVAIEAGFKARTVL